MEERSPKVTVVIPTYRRPAYLQEALDSLSRQTFTDFEAIVVDDGTPGEENRQICSKYSFVRYILTRNSGSPIRPRNIGIKEARGEYIAFLDDDDQWVEEKLQKQVDILDRQRDYGLVHSYCQIIDENGRVTGEVTGQAFADKKHGYVFDDMVGNFTVMLSSPLIRKELIEKSGLFNEKMTAAGEDVEFFIRLAYYTRFWFIDEPLVRYRVHSNGISKGNFNYVYLPWHLFRAVRKLSKKESLERSRFVALRNRLIIKQIDAAGNLKGYLVSIGLCFRICPGFFTLPGAMRTMAGKFRHLWRYTFKVKKKIKKIAA